MTQQNAALAEQSAAAAASLREQADRLAEAVAIFRLSHEQARAAIAKAQTASRAPRATQAAPAARPKPAAKDTGGDWQEF
jgi:methyl-accepting chemotaxis protein